MSNKIDVLSLDTLRPKLTSPKVFSLFIGTSHNISLTCWLTEENLGEIYLKVISWVEAVYPRYTPPKLKNLLVDFHQVHFAVNGQMLHPHTVYITASQFFFCLFLFFFCICKFTFPKLERVFKYVCYPYTRQW